MGRKITRHDPANARRRERAAIRRLNPDFNFIEERRKQRASNTRSYNRYEGNRRAGRIKREYGITVEEYDALFEEQQGLCAICKCQRPTPCRSKMDRLYIDHNHTTGAVRGLLCRVCNLHLSSFELYSKEMEGYLNQDR